MTASGVVIEGHRILTNAHAVLYASQVQIQATGAGDKISATVEAIAPGIDLAVLKLDDDGFFASHAPFVRASELPQIKDAVLAYGFPTGGTSLVDHQGHRLAHRIRALKLFRPRACASRSTRPSTPATAAVLRSRVTG